jgi:hypothetical protein
VHSHSLSFGFLWFFGLVSMDGGTFDADYDGAFATMTNSNE